MRKPISCLLALIAFVGGIILVLKYGW